MALDPEIPLGFKFPEIQGPAVWQQNALKLREIQSLEQERQMRAQQIQFQQQQMQQAQAAQQRAAQAMASFEVDPETGLYDLPKNAQKLFQSGLAPEHVETLMGGLEKMNGIARQAQQDKLTHQSKVAGVLLDMHKPDEPVTADSVHLGLQAIKRIAPFVVNDQDEQWVTNALGSGADARQVLEGVKRLGSKPDEYGASAGVVYNKGTGLSPTGQPAVKPTTPMQPKTLEEQLFDAATLGTPQETPTAQISASAIKGRGALPITPAEQARIDAEARREAQTATNESARLGLERQRLGLEAQRLAKGETADDVGISSDVKTTSTGRQYVDLSKYKGKDYHAAQQQAHAAGVYGANAGEADALQNIETARQNLGLMTAAVPKLPSSALTREAGAGLVNRAKAALQIDPTLAAWGTWRSAAIQAMRAMAGSKGLRINRAEIEASIQNDIPEMTDTQATAQEKLRRVGALLQSQETGIMGASAAPAAGQKVGRFEIIGVK